MRFFLIRALLFVFVLWQKQVIATELNALNVFELLRPTLMVDHTNKRQSRQANTVLYMESGACRTHAGETGHCRPIAYCRVPDFNNNIWRILTQLCVINQNEVGVCCTQSMQNQLVSPFADHKEQARPANQHQRGCGTTTSELSRTNAQNSNTHEWPWMAALLRVGWPQVWCGGALITERYVLTAAHCVHKIPLSELYVRLGEYNTHVINETRARDFKLSNVIVHADFDPLTYEHDVAVMHLERSAFFNTYIWPVCMPPLNENWAGKVGVISGWGSQGFGGKHSDLLLEVQLPIWQQEECQSALVERIPSTVLCAGVPAGGQDSCQGDSGGPLLYELPNKRWVVVGIVSWGIRCGEPNRPGVYTQVDRYLEWIMHNSFE